MSTVIYMSLLLGSKASGSSFPVVALALRWTLRVGTRWTLAGVVDHEPVAAPSLRVVEVEADLLSGIVSLTLSLPRSQ